MKERKPIRATQPAGFTLIEVLIVTVIIMAMAAVALPAISRYIKNYQIKSAVQGVATEIQAARNKAISRNVNYGVVFLVRSATQYQYVIEDIQGAARAGAPTPLGTLVTLPAQVGPLRELPRGIQFGAQGTLTCPGFAPNTEGKGFRFNRLGGYCNPGSASCPAFNTGTALLQNTDSGSTICLTQARTGLTQTLSVSTGGRVQTQRF
jgi:prepilin-type N-terminal cleavage/methylation domain-containing protein